MGRMRTILLSVMAIMSGCASTTFHQRTDRIYDGNPCLTEYGAGAGAWRARWPRGPGYLVRAGQQRLPDDPATAMADDEVAVDLIGHSEHDKRAGIGAFLVGGLLLAPGVGLLGYGIDQ